MKLKTTVAVTVGVGLTPALGFCAERAPEGGSWVALLFYIINFALFVFILVHYAAPAFRKFFADRSGRIIANLDRSQTNFRSATDTARQAETQLASLEAEKARLLTEMNEETARDVARIQELGQASVERIRRDAELTARSIVDRGRRIVQTHLAATAAGLAHRLITNDFEAGDQNRLLREFLSTMNQEARL